MALPLDQLDFASSHGNFELYGGGGVLAAVRCAVVRARSSYPIGALLQVLHRQSAGHSSSLNFADGCGDPSGVIAISFYNDASSSSEW